MGTTPDDGDATCTLWIVRPDGSEARLLAEVPFFLAEAHWDPTGRMIAYRAADEAEEIDLWVVSLEDGASHRIGGVPEDLLDWSLQDWSPDGAWLAVTEYVGGSEIRVNRDLLGEGEG